MKNIEIPLRKTKIFLMLLGSIVFVVAGIFFMINPAKYVSVLWRSPVFIFVGGFVSVLFFGFTGFSIIKKLLQTRTGLTINNEGIIDNSSGVSAGMIFWEDIENIDVFKVLNQKFIRIVVKNPNEYINRQTSSITRKMMAANHKKYGSPVQIPANTLKINFDELYELLQNNFLEQKEHHQS
ncbi:MAG: hypothetical protein LBG15_12470 [Dysgonamonadaceae bacterium]|nr:hypothetical protein [Dysgonamonadaceae bacterium]